MDFHGCILFLQRFQWVYCQIAYLRRCLPGRIRSALDELPDTLEETYDRALREIDKVNWEFAYRLLQCVAVASRPFLVEELSQILSFNFETGSIPAFREGWRLENPVEAVLSTTSSLLSIAYVHSDDLAEDAIGSQVIQFSHFSVKEFLTSSRLAQTHDILSRRYHISMTPAHTLAGQVCLGILLHLDKNVLTKYTLSKYPLAEYAAEHWADHARFEGVSGNIEDGMKRLFDPSKLHLAIWVWIYNPILPLWRRFRRPRMLFQLEKFPLHYAAVWGLHAMVKFLVIQHSQDVHSRAFDNNSTPLHLASWRGHVDVVRLLLEHDADPRAQTQDGQTPLHLASQDGHGHPDIGFAPVRLRCRVYATVRYGAFEHDRNTYEWSPLHLKLHEKVACLLLEHDADSSAQDKDGWTPLHVASLSGHEGVARMLFEHGADATAQTKGGETALHMASEEGHEGIVRLLLEHGADATAQIKDGWTPLHQASEVGYVGIARLLLKHGADATSRNEVGWTPLHRASLRGREGVARLLLEHGVDATAQVDNGWTPLYLASFYGHEGVTRLLLEHGLDATARDKAGRTPLHLASQNGHEGVARLLLESGADATARNMIGWTPLHRASLFGREGVIRLLLEHGVDAVVKTKNGRTALDLAMRFGRSKAVGTILENGADVTAQRKDGSTLLHLASRWGHVGVARVLFEHGVDASVPNKHGWTALHLASRWGHEEVARFLLDRGVDSTAQNKYGWTALRLALHGGHVDVARLFG